MVKPKFTPLSMRGGVAFLQRARNAIEGGFMFRPSWFETMAQHQPDEPPKAHRDNVRALEYPEDRLLEVVARNHPDLWENTIINLVPDDMGRIHYTHPAAAFVERQKMWIANGKTEKEAYQCVLEDWNRQKRFEKLELQVAILQAEQLGMELAHNDEDCWEKRNADQFQTALMRRLSQDQQKRRERLEALIEAREEAGETEPIDLLTLDPDVTQEDLEMFIAGDPRAEKHFGGEAAYFHIDIERTLPRDMEDEEYAEFREFIDETLTEEERQIIESVGPLPEHQAQYFKFFDSEMDAVRLRRRAEQRVKEEQDLRDMAELGGDDMDPDMEPGEVNTAKKKKTVPGGKGKNKTPPVAGAGKKKKD